ncbi:MAG: methyl-accepting chemotaxis protein [Defluviitaleaceae bacterium]|nr:methyl-accepting chemotaxis protein [Defluviitaleaceae bacterium]
MNLKREVCNIIRDDGHRSLANRIFSYGITTLIVINIVMVLLDLLEVIPESAEPIFFYAELVTVVVFTVEYILRLWTADILHSRMRPSLARLKYATSPMAIVDVLAVLPFYLPFAFPVNMTILRLLRLLRLLRVMKLNRYSDTKTAEVVLATIKESIVLVDTSHNFMSANNAAIELFPALKNAKKYSPITQAETWPSELLDIDNNDMGRSIDFSMGDKHYKADITSVYDKDKLLRYIIIIHDVTSAVLQERAEKERVKSTMELIHVMKNYGEGNFDCETRKYEGDWAWANEALSGLRVNIINVLKDINNLAKNASEGNFNMKVDESKFKGSWAELVRTLNDLIAAVETPLSEIEHNVVLMSEGNFSPLTGDYKGQFDTVIKACNRTNEITLSYIKEIAKVLGEVAQGDLTASVKRDYIGSYAPIKTALNTILNSLNTTMNDIQSATGQVVEGAGQISQNAIQLAEGAINQNAEIQGLIAAMETIDKRAKESAASATAANQRAESSTAAAKQGEEVIQSMHTSMDKVKESSNDISKLNKVISDIAFQTTLLALNASIEAARAGEQGKGFSVVAEEVKNLAGRSRKSTDSSTEIILANQQSADNVWLAAKDVSEAFASIADNISQMSEIIATIVEKSEQQADSISIVHAGIGEISKVVQDNSVAAQDSADASRELNAQAEMLKQLVSFFKLK